MKIALTIVAAVFAVILIITGIGALLPREHTSRRTVRLKRTPADVFALLSDVEATPRWRSDVTQVEHLPDVEGRRRWREVNARGGLSFELIEAHSPDRWVTRIADPSLPFGGTWTYQLSGADDGGTIVALTEDGFVSNPIFRFMSRFVFGHTATQDKVLKALGAHFGETVTPR